ncbi:CLUMA_CG004533, isoform A [Clunio marinus]|uniref:1-acyl-sn-glycerol-3-phosphate acyltransferase n=1 Tax=Clunio marinus TaxID=568069 RepID=A0A1J1HS85_9DIPT|nr:CLUMA_CG004533, isoform A [Clunio marinus]
MFRNFKTIKYYVKYIFFCFMMTIVPTLLLPYFLMRPKNVLNLIPASKILRITSRIIGVKFTLRGHKHLEEERAAVIISNHQSSLDILGMLEIWPVMKRTTVIARMLLLFAGPFGIGAWLCGLVFINKDSADRGKKKMNKAMEKLKNEKTKLWVFPEGYRNRAGTIDEFKKGAFHLAIDAQVPIIPVVFSSYLTFTSKEKKIFNSGEILIEALPAIPTKGLKSEDINELIKTTRDIIVKKYEELNSEIENKKKS